MKLINYFSDRLLISSFSFENKCELLALLNEQVNQEKWARVTTALSNNADRRRSRKFPNEVRQAMGEL